MIINNESKLLNLIIVTQQVTMKNPTTYIVKKTTTKNNEKPQTKQNEKKPTKHNHPALIVPIHLYEI